MIILIFIITLHSCIHYNKDSNTCGPDLQCNELYKNILNNYHYYYCYSNNDNYAINYHKDRKYTKILLLLLCNNTHYKIE